ncbi:Rrf2 family transcriptional regulator [Paraglaciecola sp. L3A3]|uniref:Rrf2 family transcriptional regulator n=1 Tax=Paraglaciecola sp. L3A3 TaxID=2686358 RepID=UPI00131E169C|nr:Rrf2 family transcriptional regulator [Paraglaciecola sp. L3A3]
MQLTRYTDYGLRTLIYLALLPAGRKASIDEISQTYGISRNNLNKIVHQLGKANIIQTQRGKGGGIFLEQAPDKINIGDMVMLLENTLQVVECEKPACCISPACKLKGIFADATQAFISSLERYYLSDLLLEEQKPLLHILL